MCALGVQPDRVDRGGLAHAEVCAASFIFATNASSLPPTSSARVRDAVVADDQFGPQQDLTRQALALVQTDGGFSGVQCMGGTVATCVGSPACITT